MRAGIFGVERCRRFGGPLLEKREKWRTHVYFGRDSKTNPRYTSPLKWPTRPDGEYVVIQYESSFEHKQSAVETVTSMLDKDGTWRVSGYFIR